MPQDFTIDFLSGGGEVGSLIRQFDWSKTTLGPIGDWPGTVTTTIGTILASPLPIMTLWGSDGVMIYNDAYATVAGGRHPGLLGLPVREGWPEVSGFNDRVMRVVLAGGRAQLSRPGDAAQPLWQRRDGVARSRLLAHSR